MEASAFSTLILGFRILVAISLAGAATLGSVSLDWPPQLNIALFVMAGVVLLETATLFLWARPYAGASSTAPPPEEARNPYADAAKIAITTQGVVLGLVAFQDGRLPNATLKVGAAALVAGVLIAGTLYLNVAFGPPPDLARKFAAGILFSLVYWCLGFGLICVVAGSWS